MTITSIFRAMRANFKLGWDMEGNWAPPWLYLLISLAAPAAGTLMLVFMYLVILGNAADKTFLAFMIGGAAVFMFVKLVLAGAGWAVIEDREHYKILRYIYIAPSPFPAQLLGRIGFKLIVAAFGSALTLLAGWLALGIPFQAGGIGWGTLFGSLVLGMIGMLALGWILASSMLLVDRMGWVWAEGISGLLFLICGFFIPLSILPAPIAWVSRLLPLTYWTELWRHALYGATTALSLPNLTEGQLWVGLTVTSITTFVVAVGFYRISDWLARRWGRIETETFY